jgi:hypothetical protein
MRNRNSAPIPAPGSTLCKTDGGVGDGVIVAVGVCVGVLGISVMVGVGDGVMVGVAVFVGVGVNVHIGGIGVAVFLSRSGSVGHGPPTGPPHCAKAVWCGVPVTNKHKARVAANKISKIFFMPRTLIFEQTYSSGYTFQPKSSKRDISNCSCGTLMCMPVPSASNSFVSAS